MTTVEGYYLIMDKCIKNKLIITWDFIFCFILCESEIQDGRYCRTKFDIDSHENLLKIKTVLRQLKDLTEIKFHMGKPSHENCNCLKNCVFSVHIINQ